MTTQPFRRDRFTWLAYFLLAFYGYFLNILGPITPFLKEELNLSYTISSLHFTAFALGILLIGMGGQIIIQRIGRGHALWTGAFGMTITILILLAGKSPFITIGAAFGMGLIGSLILVIVLSGLSDQHGEKRAVAISEANVIASLVSAAAPLMVGWCANLPGGWRLAMGTVAFTPLVLRFGFGKFLTIPQPSDQENTTHNQPLPFMYWVYWTAVVLAVSVEFCMIFWGADYLETNLGVQKAIAAEAVSLFLAGMIVGRLAGSRLVQRFSTHTVTISAILLAGFGFSLFWLTGNANLAMLGMFITGLGVASLYPLILALAIGSAPSNTVKASLRGTLASGAAVLLLPLVLGSLADIFGIWKAFGIIIVLLVGVFLIMIFTIRKSNDLIGEYNEN
ncbi:MAG: MFS transporter [Anaerolineales bacterium]|nr:MFS transporter [Anaerolineales bacterium]